MSESAQNGFTEGEEAIIEKVVRRTVDYLIDRGAVATPEDIVRHARDCGERRREELDGALAQVKTPALSPQPRTFSDRIQAAVINASVTVLIGGTLYALWEGIRFYLLKGGSP